jgi:endoglucanase
VAGTTAGAPRLAIIGHIDEIGLMVSHIDDEGFLWFGGVGGWDPVNLVGQRVELHTKDGTVPGVVGKKPIHLLESDEREKAPKLKDLHIDVGAKDGDEARSLVRVGDWAVVAGEPVELAPVAWRRARWTTAWAAGSPWRPRAWSPRPAAPPARSSPVRSPRRRSRSAARRRPPFSLEPDVAIVVDVTHATDAPSIDKRQEGDHGLGSGAVRPADHAPAGRRPAARRRRGGGHRPREEAAARVRSPTPTRSPQPPRGAAGSSRSRCATCTRRSRSCSSPTSGACARLIAAFAQA